MPLRPPAGFIRPGFDPLKNPDAPTAVEATGGDASASVSFTPPANVGGSAISEYYAVSNPDRVTVSGASSPINVTGLTNGTAYTFAVWALNTYGPGPFSAASGSVSPSAPLVAFGGGRVAGTGDSTNTIDYISVSTTGNASDWGDLSVARFNLAACGSSTRGVFIAGNREPVSPTATNVMDYITFSSQGNAVDFGDVANPDNNYQWSAASNATRGIITRLDDIFYITIASTGNTSDFGNWGTNKGNASMAANATRAVAFGGEGGGGANTILYVEIATTGSQATFGSITLGTGSSAGSSETRGVQMGGTGTNVINYITFATTGNAVDFGDLSPQISQGGGGSSKLRAVVAGGLLNGGSETNIIEYVTIATLGDAADFGDLTVVRKNLAGASNASGGV
jgi:hypothetical protein